MTGYIIARTAGGRPSLQHALVNDGITTECGLDTSWWSRAYQSQMISQVICKKCRKKVAG